MLLNRILSNMKPNLVDIQSHLEKSLGITGIRIIDDSHLHQTHTNFQEAKAYLTIRLPRIKTLSRLKLHRLVMQYANEVCNQPIHAIAVITY